ncbi:MAG: DUF493 domain-containing protein [Gammaproteobacteria bacterium]|nr:DUF493 domain-containing protein [Gammaproteobacteria bacterium]
MSTDAPLIEFPCDFPIKVFGLPDDDFVAMVVDLVTQHTGPVAAEAIATRSSRGGKYVAVTITVRASSREQMDRVYQALCAERRILMAL